MSNPVYHEAWAIIVEGSPEKPKLQDVQFADAMVTAVLSAFDRMESLGIAPAEKVLTTVEGQQVYARPEDPRQKLVAMGNDLLRLGQITGAVQARTRLAPFDGSRVYLPPEWKGQAPKTTMHADTAARLGSIPARLLVIRRGGKVTERTMKATDLADLPPAMGHALDGVCLAEFGLDRYQDGRWDYRW